MECQAGQIVKHLHQIDTVTQNILKYLFYFQCRYIHEQVSQTIMFDRLSRVSDKKQSLDILFDVW